MKTCETCGVQLARVKELEEQLAVAHEIGDSFWAALKALNLSAIYVANPGLHVTEVIAERDALREVLSERSEAPKEAALHPSASPRARAPMPDGRRNYGYPHPLTGQTIPPDPSASPQLYKAVEPRDDVLTCEHCDLPWGQHVVRNTPEYPKGVACCPSASPSGAPTPDHDCEPRP